MLEIETILVQSNCSPEKQNGFVSPPVYRGSTTLYSSVSEMESMGANHLKNSEKVYGRFGNPNSRSFESALSELEGGYGTVTTVTGLSAITTALLSFAKSGDHILIADSVYFPTRRFCDSLKRFGIETEYYDPMLGKDIANYFRKNTRIVYMESPGSLTFEIQDVRAIAEVCQAHGILSIIDNTWATPLYFQPLKLGVNISIHSATKYITGHSDSFLGTIICDEKTYESVRLCAIDLGQKASADDIHLGLRGLRTLSVRLEQHSKNALELAQWLQQRQEVVSVYHPGLPTHPNYEIWKKEFSGSSGLFTIELKKSFTKIAVEEFINSLKLFGIGHSWGGYESLIVPINPSDYRKFGAWTSRGPLIRIHVGLENVNDLKRDLEMGFTKLNRFC